MDWMKTSVGVSVHWTSQTVGADGARRPYPHMVDEFDVEGFARALSEAGAQHCIFTLTHAQQYMAFPNEPLEALLPGRTTARDLLGELAEALNRAGIRLIAYYNHSCNGEDDPQWKRACGYAAGQAGDLDAFARHIAEIVGFTARRYGRLLSGWWFDSAYSLDPSGPNQSISCDMGEWRFPWGRLIEAARSGNDECAVAINAGIGSRFQYAPGADYYAGESLTLDERFSPEAQPGLVDHRWLCIDNPSWVFTDAQRGFSRPRFETDAVARFIREGRAAGRMTTFNMEINREG